MAERAHNHWKGCHAAHPACAARLRKKIAELLMEWDLFAAPGGLNAPGNRGRAEATLKRADRILELMDVEHDEARENQALAAPV